jgi:hypothetical protein
MAYQEWLSHFQAADSSLQDYCLSVLINSTRFGDKGGEVNQDIFMFRNVFKYWPMQGRKGFFVESGANDPLISSNSFFFEKCLGWDGLCVEPQPEYHQVNA